MYYTGSDDILSIALASLQGAFWACIKWLLAGSALSRKALPSAGKAIGLYPGCGAIQDSVLAFSWRGFLRSFWLTVT